jgi:hypothetical protein
MDAILLTHPRPCVPARGRLSLMPHTRLGLGFCHGERIERFIESLFGEHVLF